MKKFKVVIYKKTGSQSFSNKNEEKIILSQCITSIDINKKEDTSVGEATIKFQYENVDLANFGGGDKGIVDNFAKIEVWIENKIQFTGVIKRYSRNTETKIFTLFCHDMYYRMNNTCRKPIRWQNTKASQIISCVCRLAGLELKILGGEDYIVKILEIDIGTMFHDIISNLIETMHARIRCSKSGVILLEYQYPPYDEKYHERNHYDFYYKSDINIENDDSSCRDATQMRNFLKISCEGKWILYEDEVMTKYLNGENWLETYENPLATTAALKFKVAGQKFLDMWRESTSISILPVVGDPEMDLGKIARVVSKGYSGYYLIIGIDTSITDNGYTDTLQLRGMRDATKIYLRCKKVDEWKSRPAKVHILSSNEKKSKADEIEKIKNKVKKLKEEREKANDK